MWFNILNLLSWSTWMMIILIILFVFWIIWGGRQEYEFVGLKPLQNPKLFEELPSVYSASIHEGNKGEDLVAEALENILSSRVYRNLRPDFLKNPETGKNLEIDCYNEQYNIAVEYNGIQHYKFPSVFYKTEKDFYNQIYRDRLKLKLCDENGVYLISVPYWVDMYDSQEEHIKSKDSVSKPACLNREVRYKRIYDFLYKKLNEYFEKIMASNENEQPESIINRRSLYDLF